MYTKIDLSDNCCLWESYLGGFAVKYFQFEYKGVTVDTKLEYEIYYQPEEFKDKFQVRGNFETRSFDTLLEAKEYVYKHVAELKEKLDKEQIEIKEYIEKKNRRKRKKGDK